MCMDEDVFENVSDETDGTAIKSAVAEYLTENKVTNHDYQALEIPEEKNSQYVRFNNEYELNSELNGKSNDDCYSDSSSNTSSNDSISFRRIVLTPIEENEVKLSNGYD